MTLSHFLRIENSLVPTGINEFSIYKDWKFVDTAALIPAGGGDIDQVKLSKTTTQKEKQTICEENL